MSLETEMKKLTAAIEALPEQLAAALGGVTTTTEPEEKPKAAAKEEKPKAAAKEEKPKAAAKKTSAKKDPAVTTDDIVAFVRKYVGSMAAGSDEQQVAAAKIRQVFEDVGAAKAGDVPADKCAEVLESLRKIEAGEDEEEEQGDDADSLI